MRSPRVRHFLERVSGTVLVALGLKVAWDGAREL
jgi:threonine/homoserine/homoserine lactone efflux protein